MAPVIVPGAGFVYRGPIVRGGGSSPGGAPGRLEAVKWFRKAAEQDLALAQVHLGRMYYNGRGVSQDLVRAHMWFNLNASSLPVGPNQYQSVKNRDLVAKIMTPGQIAEAQRLAREWTAKHSR